MCRHSPKHFLEHYGHVYDATRREWLPFTLWPAQADTLGTLHNEQLLVILKARQLGLTWLCLGYALWMMLFRPAATVMIFSRRQDEADYLLGVERLRGMYSRLPEWMLSQCKGETAEPDATRTWMLRNGSICRAFPTTAGDSYTATFALVDEADLCPDLDRMLGSVKPTIDGGGKLILLSRADKSKPESVFKRIYRSAKDGLSPWKGIFLPWSIRPDRDAAWYEAQKQDALARTGGLDVLHEQYPATDTEALAPRQLDKRIPAQWLRQCFHERKPLGDAADFTLPGLEVYAKPERGKYYVIGADPAQGNPTSDDSAATVLDTETGEEVASLCGKSEPSVFASYLDKLGKWYNGANLMVERNNHGHAVLLWLKDNSHLRVLDGHDKQPGWLSSSKGKAILYDACADAFRDGQTTLHSFATFTQLAGIEGATLLAPEGEKDDRADGYALALVGLPKAKRSTWVVIPEPPPRSPVEGRPMNMMEEKW